MNEITEPTAASTAENPDILGLGWIVGETYNSYGGGLDTVLGYTEDGCVKVRDEDGRIRHHLTATHGRQPVSSPMSDFTALDRNMRFGTVEHANA